MDQDDEPVREEDLRWLAMELEGIGASDQVDLRRKLQEDRPGEEERRIRLLLRLTLDEVHRIASDADLRAEMLRKLLSERTVENQESAFEEIENLHRVAEALRKTADLLLAEIRETEGD